MQATPPNTPQTPTRRARSIIYAAALAVLWVAFLLPRSEQAQAITSASAPPAAPALAKPLATAGPRARAFAGTPAAAIARNERAPTIHAIKLDKDSVCRGELNFANVYASGPDGGDAHLRIALTGDAGAGPRIPFRVFEPETLPKVVVEGRGGARVEAPLPALQIRDCEEPRIAQVDAHVVGASTDEWKFTTRLTRGEFSAASYEWDFGDGSRETTREPWATHSYRYRSQDKRYSSFLVSVTVRDSNGGLLTTSKAVGLVNLAFGMLQRHGQVGVFARNLEQPDGERVELYHAHHSPVRLDRVAVSLHANGSSSGRQLGAFSALEVLGVEHLVPGEPKEAAPKLAALLPAERPAHLLFELAGASADGLPVVGTFSLVIR